MIFVVVRTLGFLLVRRVLSLVGFGPTPDATDVEIAVLRHQLVVLRRQVARPHYTPTDRLLLATLARMLPRERWPLFLVTPFDAASLAPGPGAPPLAVSAHRAT